MKAPDDDKIGNILLKSYSKNNYKKFLLHYDNNIHKDKTPDTPPELMRLLKI